MNRRGLKCHVRELEIFFKGGLKNTGSATVDRGADICEAKFNVGRKMGIESIVNGTAIQS